MTCTLTVTLHKHAVRDGNTRSSNISIRTRFDEELKTVKAEDGEEACWLARFLLPLP